MRFLNRVCPARHSCRGRPMIEFVVAELRHTSGSRGGGDMMRASLLVGICAAAFAAIPAMAADLPLKAPPPMVVPPFSWTGFYIGANIGGAWSHSTITDVATGATFNTDNNGFIGGGQVGFN